MNSEEIKHERKRKQKYLKEEILDNDAYHSDDFIEYIKNIKENIDGTDVDNWTFPELIEIVQEFKFREYTLNSTSFYIHLLNPY
jgi:hypothetical protein